MAKSAIVERLDDNSLVTKVKAWPQRAKSFYNDVRTEMRKVTTPSRKEVQGTTTVVIITVFLFGIYFAVLDKLLGTIARPLDQEFDTSLMRVNMTEEEIKSENNGAEPEQANAVAETQPGADTVTEPGPVGAAVAEIEQTGDDAEAAVAGPGDYPEPEYEVVHHPHLFGIRAQGKGVAGIAGARLSGAGAQDRPGADPDRVGD